MGGRVVILGAGGHGKVVLAAVLASGYSVPAILDDDTSRWGASLQETTVSGPIDRAEEWADCLFMIGIGNNEIRRRIHGLLPTVKWATIIHPMAWVAPDVSISPGTVVMAGAVVQPGVRIGAHVVVNTASSVDHDAVIGDYVHLAPGCHTAGEVAIDEGVLLGIGSSVLPRRRVGAWAAVGAGAVVVDDVLANATVVGVPARQIKLRDE